MVMLSLDTGGAIWKFDMFDDEKGQFYICLMIDRMVILIWNIFVWSFNSERDDDDYDGENVNDNDDEYDDNYDGDDDNNGDDDFESWHWHSCGGGSAEEGRDIAVATRRPHLQVEIYQFWESVNWPVFKKARIDHFRRK